MKIPISNNTICGKIAKKITGIIFSSAKIQRTAYIMITIPSNRRNLLM